MPRLVAHGFVDLELKDNYENICEIQPHAREIARLGPEQIINGQQWQFLERSLGEPGSYVGWYTGSLYREGTYGKIYKAHRMVVTRRADKLFDVAEPPMEIVVKKTEPPSGSLILPAEDVNAHTSEALLHVLAWQAMQCTVTPWAIPRPYEVFGDYSETPTRGWRSMSLCMSYVSGRTLYSFLKKHWKRDVGSLAANALIFLELLAQIAYILGHLQQELRLNHRDVKVNNLLVRRRSTPLILDIGGVTIATVYEVTLIDFGFACVGCPAPRPPMTVFQAGSWFPVGELCCKEGRDLAQLLYCIHCYYPFETYLPASLFAVVRSWLQVPWSGGVADLMQGFTKEGRPSVGPAEFHTGIYEFLRRPEVDPVTCAPLTVFRAIAGLLR